MDGDPFRSTIVILAGYFGMILVALVTFCFFKRYRKKNIYYILREILLTFRSVTGKIDIYTMNLETQRDENKKRKSQHNSAFSVATVAAKAGFNRKRKKVAMMHCENLCHDYIL